MYGEPLDEIAYRINEWTVHVQMDYAISQRPDDVIVGMGHTSEDGWTLRGYFDESGPLKFEWTRLPQRGCACYERRDGAGPDDPSCITDCERYGD